MTRNAYPDTADGFGRLGETQAAIEAGLVAAGSDDLADGKLHAFVIPATAKVELVDVVERLAAHQANPERKRGTFQAHSADSFVAYLAKHRLSETEVWADVHGQKVIGVLNAH